MRYLRILLLTLPLWTTGLHSQVNVEILNMPREVHSFGPVYVLYAVENTGRSPLYLPAEGAPFHGPGLYLAPEGDTPKPPPAPVPERVFAHSMQNMWLAPGERWLFYQDIGYHLGILEGDLSIQAVMSSDGRCGDELTYGRRSFPLDSLRIDTVQTGIKRAEVFRCWEGEVRSSAWTLTVTSPSGTLEKKAFDYLLDNGGLIHNEETGRWTLGWASGLRQKFPSSHYTYALSTWGVSNVFAKRFAVELQPDNPLNPWVLGAIARDVLDHRSSCWEGRPLGFEFSIEDAELPAGVREYLDQYAWYLEHRHCPRVRDEQAEKGGERG